MEDDAGKSIHEGFKDSDRYSYVDLNRCGTPLIEIVSEPDMRSSDEAYAYLTELKHIMQFVEVSACDMEKGQLRCDANVSVRLKGAEKFGTKAEVKNLNSFRFLKMALDYEIARQVAVIEGGGRVEQETRLYDAAHGRNHRHAQQGITRMTTAIFPSPISSRCASANSGVNACAPPCRSCRRRSASDSSADYKLPEYDANWLTADRAVSDYFEAAAAVAGDPKAAANWVMGDLAAALKTQDKDIAASPVSAENLGDLIALSRKGEISGKLAKEIFAKMFATGDAPAAIIEREGLKQISDTGALEKIVDEVIAANPKQVEQYRAGRPPSSASSSARS